MWLELEQENEREKLSKERYGIVKGMTLNGEYGWVSARK